MTINKAKQYKQRNGTPVEILATDLTDPKEYPVIAKYTDRDGDVVTSTYTREGNFIYRRSGHDFDLVEVKEKRKAWVAISFHSDGTSSAGSGKTAESAERALRNLRQIDAKPAFACVEVEVEEGEGLE